jgi:ferrous iron transport protein A
MDKSGSNKKSANSTGNASSKRISLARMRAGQKGKIIRISGGHGIAGKLEALGIRQGQEIKKISDQWMRGPVLLQHGSSQLALGFGMASKVLVKITGEDK